MLNFNTLVFFSFLAIVSTKNEQNWPTKKPASTHVSKQASKFAPILSIVGDFFENRIFPTKSIVQHRIQELPVKSLVTIFDLFCNIADQPTYALTQQVSRQLKLVEQFLNETFYSEFYPIIAQELNHLRELHPHKKGAIENNVRIFIKIVNKLAKSVDSDVFIGVTSEIGNGFRVIGAKLDNYGRVEVTEFDNPILNFISSFQPQMSNQTLTCAFSFQRPNGSRCAA